jgi:hypothetical protein
MDSDSVFITDIKSIKEFIQLQREQEDYFDHVMDRAMSKRKA